MVINVDSPSSLFGIPEACFGHVCEGISIDDFLREKTCPKSGGGGPRLNKNRKENASETLPFFSLCGPFQMCAGTLQHLLPPHFLPTSLTLPMAMDCALNSGTKINSSSIEFRLVIYVVTAREN